MTTPINTPFKVGETYQIRNGSHVTILAHNTLAPNYPVIGTLQNGDVHFWTADGFFHFSKKTGANDLIPPLKEKRFRPLCHNDIVPGTVFRDTTWEEGAWEYLTPYGTDKIRMHGLVYGYQDIFDTATARIRFPNGDWQPCRMEVSDE